MTELKTRHKKIIKRKNDFFIKCNKNVILMIKLYIGQNPKSAYFNAYSD